jgi:hypothetical protein
MHRKRTSTPTNGKDDAISGAHDYDLTCVKGRQSHFWPCLRRIKSLRHFSLRVAIFFLGRGER